LSNSGLDCFCLVSNGIGKFFVLPDLLASKSAYPWLWWLWVVFFHSLPCLQSSYPFGWAFCLVEIRRGMCGLPQAGLLAQELLEKRLNKHGYFQSTRTPGLWTHKWRPVQFTLIVEDFGIKYVGEENLQHLITVLKDSYEISIDREGTRYVGVHFD
jgi:hypothetical protein